MYERILLTTDFSPAAERLRRFVTGIAKAVGAEMYLIHVAEEESYFGARSSDELIHFFQHIAKARDEWMDRICAETTDAGVPCTQVLAHGIASEQILNTIDEVNADLVAMATVGVEGRKRVLIGSTTKRVLRDAPCPVLTANPHWDREVRVPQRLLFPFDFSDAANRAVARAATLADEFDMTIELLRILKVPTLIPSLPGEPPISLPPASLDRWVRDTENELAGVADRLGTERVTHAVAIASDEAESIADHAAESDADMVVIPRSADGAFKQFFCGRVAHAVVKLSPIPVLTIGHVTISHPKATVADAEEVAE